MLGAALPLGNVYAGVPMSDVTPTGLLIGLDFAWGPVLRWDLGFALMSTLGLGEPRACPQPSQTCSLAISGQFAPRFRYHFAPEQAVSPWLSLGAGIDVLSSSGETVETDSSFIFENTRTTTRKASYFGPLLLLQAGADLRLRKNLFLGPQLGLALSSYSSVSRSVRLEDSTTETPSASLDSSLHAWLYLAVNMTFDIRLY